MVALVGASFAGCWTGSDGLLPPSDALYFPTGLAVSPGRTTLYVANSDFDLQYNGGTVLALRLGGDGALGLRDRARSMAEAIEAGSGAAEACAAIGTVPNPKEFVYPGPCEPADLAPYVGAFAGVGAFASGVDLAPRLDGDGLRLFVAVRGDPSVTYFDVVDDRDPSAPVSPCGEAFCLECRAAGDDRRCGVQHRIGNNPYGSLRGLTLPTEPVGLDAARLVSGDALVVSHQTENAASLIVNRWGASSAGSGSLGPALEHIVGDLQAGPTAVASIPPPAYVAAVGPSVRYRPGFVLGHRGAAALTVLRYEADLASRPPRPFLIRSEELALTISADGSDSRGMAIDASEREACEAACTGDVDCLRGCLDVPLRFYLASRSPASLIVGTIQTEIAETDGVVTSLSEKISLDESVPMPIGASQVAVGDVVGPDGELERRVFTVAFDTRAIVSYDPVLRRVDAIVRTGRGPFGIAFDTGPVGGGAGTGGELESYLYVGHFTDSYLGVVDLDTRRASYGTMLVSFGPPRAPREEQ